MTPITLVDSGDPAGLASDDRGLLYGDGLFETMALRRGALRFRAAHVARLRAGCERLGFDYPGTRVDALLARLLPAGGNGTVRLVVTRGSGPRGYAPPREPTLTLIGHCYPAPPSDTRPIQARMCRTPLAHSPALAGLKTLNRLEQVLARGEWQDASIAEGLMCDPGGSVVCGTASNLFVGWGERIVTPRIDGSGVRGIMRGVVLQAATEAGIAITEAVIRPADLANATELFVTNALMGIAPVIALDGRPIPVGELTRRLRTLLAEHGVDECASAC